VINPYANGIFWKLLAKKNKVINDKLCNTDHEISDSPFAAFFMGTKNKTNQLDILTFLHLTSFFSVKLKSLSLQKQPTTFNSYS